MTTTTTADVRAGLYRVDAARSEISFRATGLFGLPVRGTFAIREGTVNLSAGSADAIVRAVVDLASFASNNRRRDADVKSGRFLDVERYPDLVFAGHAVADGRIVEGTLDRHGTTGAATVHITAATPTANGYEVTATARVDRHSLGVTGGKGFVGRHIDLTFRVALTAA